MRQTMAVYNGRLRIIGNGDLYDYRFSPLLELIPPNNKNSLFTRHIIVNIQVLTKLCTIIVEYCNPDRTGAWVPGKICRIGSGTG